MIPVRRRPTTLTDAHGRVHRDLRISVTDRCNLRCTYCMDEGFAFRPRSELLTFEEIERVARVARRLGLDRVRLTGGEPLLRSRITDLVARVASVGFEDLSMTTNGQRLGPLAGALRRAGVTRVNISCDSLRPERFPRIRRHGDLKVVLEAMDAAEEAGLVPVKVNVVLIAGVNDDEILDFAAFARDTGRIVRFIEFMPLDADSAWSPRLVVPGHSVVARIGAQWPLEAVCSPGDPAPAERFRFLDDRGEIGVISSVTRPFCATCDRLRLTADGALRNCLFSNEELSVRDVMRTGGTDRDIETLFLQAVRSKLPGHRIGEPGFRRPDRSMSMIGG